MAILGTYLVLKLNDEVIAEATDVEMRIKAKPLNTTTKESGLNAEFIGGMVVIAIAGKYLFTEDNWDTLFGMIGSEVGVSLFRDEVQFLGGNGILKKLSAQGGNSDQTITGAYGIRYKTTSDNFAILTEAGFDFITEDAETIILE